MNKHRMQKQAEKAIDDTLLLAQKTETRINKLIQITINNIDKAIRELYFKYKKRYKLTDTEALQYLHQQLTRQQITQLVSQGYLDKADAISTANQINRLIVLKKYIKMQTAQLAVNYTNNLERLLINTTSLAYNKTIFNISKEVGFQLSFQEMPKKKIDKLLHHNWLDSDFYKRIQNNCGKLQDKVEEVLTDGVLRGKSIDYMSKELQKTTHYGQKAAEKLVRTEVAHFHNKAEMEAYKELDIEKYIYLATLDDRTCEKCRELDGKVFVVGDPNSPVPPIHPRSRSTTIAYIDQHTLSNMKRRAKVNGKTIVIPKYITYRQWEKQIKGVQNNGKSSKTNK